VNSRSIGSVAKEAKVIAKTHVQKRGTLKRIGGSQSDHWNHIVANDTLQALWLSHSDDQTRGQKFKAAIDGLVGIAPQDELEGMMAAQLIAAHSAAMECYRRAMIPEQTFDGRHESLNQASKLSRTFAELLEALNRHRGKGHQKVTVEHVHVHSGGQAVVGAVTTTGGGDRVKSEEQPHALANATSTEMWSANAAPESVPSTGDAERKVPDARRHVVRRTEG
jgi:hypothetical protein